MRKLFNKGDQVVIVDDTRTILGHPPVVVNELDGQIGTVLVAWKPRFSHAVRAYDVQVGKQVFIYMGNRLRKASPLDLLANAAE